MKKASDILEQIDLLEMGNLDNEDTTFPHVIWVGPPDARHGPRIKVVNEPGRVDPSDSVLISISDTPEILAGTAGHELNAKKLRWIYRWIVANKDLLLKHSRMEISDRQLRDQLRRVRW